MRLGSGLGSGARLDEEDVHVRPYGKDDQRVALIGHAEDRTPVVGARGVEVLVEELPRDAYLVRARVRVRGRVSVSVSARTSAYTRLSVMGMPCRRSSTASRYELRGS